MEHARVVIIGGGVGGTSIAYHLAALGWTVAGVIPSPISGGDGNVEFLLGATSG